MLTLALLGGAALTLPEDVFRLLEAALAPPKKARQDDVAARGRCPVSFSLPRVPHREERNCWFLPSWDFSQTAFVVAFYQLAVRNLDQ